MVTANSAFPKQVIIYLQVFCSFTICFFLSWAEGNRTPGTQVEYLCIKVLSEGHSHRLRAYL